jgi:hypothetical protein
MFVGALLMAAVAAFLIHPEFLRFREESDLLNSDALYVPLISSDIVNQGFPVLRDWFLTPAPYYFPDILWGVLSAGAIGSNIPDQILAIGTLQLIGLALAPLPLMAYVLTQRLPGRARENFLMNAGSSFLTSALLLSLILSGLNLLYRGGGLPVVNSITIWPILSGHHFGAIILSVLLPGLCLLGMVRADRHGARRDPTLHALLGGLITISVVSDIFLFAWFSIPYLLTAILSRRQGSQAATQGINLTVASSSVVGLLLFYTTNPALSNASRPQTGLRESLAGLHHLAAHMGHNGLLYLVASPLALILLLASLRRASVGLRTPVVYILTLILAACAAPILQGHFQTYDDDQLFRYTLILAFIPLLALHAASLLPTLRHQGHSRQLPISDRARAALGVSLLLLSLACLGVFLAERRGLHGAYANIERPAIPTTMNKDDCAYALYWDAKKMRALFGIDTVQVSSLDSLDGYRWITNKDWLPSQAKRCRFAIQDGRVVPHNARDS